MEPRWRKDWSRSIQCIGGTAKMDLWLTDEEFVGEPHERVRAVWGDGSTPHWEFVFVKNHTLVLYRPDGLLDPPTQAELAEAYLYLKLFCPDVWVALKIEGKDGA